MSENYQHDSNGKLVSWTNAGKIDAITSDIGAMKYSETPWKAGITWNNTSDSDETYVNNNRLTFYPITDIPTTSLPELSANIVVVSKDGNNTTGTGSINNPYNTVDHAMTQINGTTKDTIIMRGGEYNFPKVLLNKKVAIKPKDGEKVVLDGSKSIDLLRDSAHPDGVWKPFIKDVVKDDAVKITDKQLYRIKLRDDVEIWQLFYDDTLNRREIINARWPSAQWSDDSVYNNDKWGHGYYDYKLNGDLVNKAGIVVGNGVGDIHFYNNGEIVDYPHGPNNLHAFINRVKESNIHFTLDNSLINLNVGSFKTYTKKINNTIIDNVNNLVRIAYDPVGLWKEKHHYYYLENKLEYLNSENEWFFNNIPGEKYLYVWLTGDEIPTFNNIRAKIQSYSFDVRSDNVEISGLNFFATTFNASGSDNLLISNCNFLYPSCYAHMLGKVNYNVIPNWASDEVFSSNTTILNSKKCIIENCVFKYTDGSAIETGGEGNMISDCYFNYIDKTVANLSSVMTTLRMNGNSNILKNNTIHKTGASSTLNPGNKAIVEYNNLYESGYLQSDGAMIHCMVNQQTDIKIRHNWCHDTIKYGIRFDGDGEGHDGYIHHNICWNCEGGIMVKGGELDTDGVSVGGHFVYNNTVFNSQTKNDIIVLNIQKGKPINHGSVVMNNLAEKIYGHRSDPEVFDSTRITTLNNYSPASVTQNLVNALDYDFRPINNASIVGAGNTEYLNKEFKYGLVSIPAYIGTIAISSIGDTVFLGNTSITHLEISKDIVSIGNNAFKGCTNLLDVGFNPVSTIATIGLSAFQECINLETIQIPDSITVIRDNAFDTCKKLKNVSIGLNHNSLSLTTIGDNVFNKCYNLENVTIHKNPKDFSLGTGGFRFGSSINGEQVFKITKNPAYTATPYTIDIATPTLRTDYGTLSLTSGHGITITNVENSHTDSIEVSKMIDWTMNILNDIILEHSTDVTIYADFSDTLGENTLGQASTNNDGTNSITLARQYLYNNYLVQINNKLEPYLYGVFLHEVIHCLGIRINAGVAGMPSFSNPPGNDNSLVPTSSGFYTTYYIGSKGVDRYNQILDSNNHGDQNRLQTITVTNSNGVDNEYRFLFLENDGGAGTVLSHPDEGQDYRDYNGTDYPSIGGEITTGYYNQTGNVISVLTGGFLEDIGYKVNYGSQYMVTNTRDADYFYINHRYNTILNDQFSGDNFKIFNIPPTIQTIGVRAFMNCSQLLRIQIPNNLKILPNSVFKNCPKLEYVKIGTDKNSHNRLYKIEANAFEGCTSLKSLELYTKNPFKKNEIMIETGAFNGTAVTQGLANIKDALTIISVSYDEFRKNRALESGYTQDRIDKIETTTLADIDSFTQISDDIKITSIIPTTDEEKKERIEKRHSLIKLLFSSNSGKSKFKIDKESLGFSNNAFFQKNKVLVKKAGDTLDVSAETSGELGWYCALDNGEDITISPSQGSTYKITKLDDKYTVELTSGGSLTVNSYVPVGDTNFDVSNNSGYFVDGDSVVINGEDQFFGGVLSNGDSGASSGGDPYICTIYGELYKIDNINGCCRMIQGTLYNKPFIINVELSIDSILEEKGMNNWVKDVQRFKKHTKLDNTYYQYNQSFYTKIYIQHGDSYILFDLANNRLIDSKGAITLETMGKDNNQTTLEMYKHDTVKNAYRVSINDMHVKFNTYYNMQLRNSIDIVGGKLIENAYGMIVKPMSTKICQISSINNVELLSRKDIPLFNKKIVEYFESIDKNHKHTTKKFEIPCF